MDPFGRGMSWLICAWLNECLEVIKIKWKFNKKSLVI